MTTEWGTIDYYCQRLSSPTPPLHIDVCDTNVTDAAAIRLADALTSRRPGGRGGGRSGGATLRKLRLRGSQVTSRGFLALAEAIGGVCGSTSALEELDLGHTLEIANDVDDFAFGMFLLLSAATNLKHIDLEGCYIGRRAGMALGDVIEAHGASLETINLRSTALEDDSTSHLAVKVRSNCKALNRVDLGWNFIGPLGAKAWADYIATDPPLQHLVLWGNCIGDAGVKYFAKGLRTNSTLIELNLGYNRISSLGLEALLYAIFDASSLNALMDSNHRLCYLFPSKGCAEDMLRNGCDVQILYDIDNILQLNEVNTLLKKSPDKLPAWTSELPLSSMSIEQLKVVIYLTKCFDTGTGMRHFLKMDRAVIPQVLEFMAAHFGYEKVFHLVGHWNMPELFLPQTGQACQ